MATGIFTTRLIKLAHTLGEQIHLRSVRDAFATLMPFFIIAGLMVLVNNVILKPDNWLAEYIGNDAIRTWRTIGDAIINGSLNFIGILIAAAVSWHLCINKNQPNPIAPVLLSIATFVIFMPDTLSALLAGGKDSVMVTGVLSYSSTGTSGMFLGILTGLIVTSVFLRLLQAERLQIRISDDGSVPPAVIASFNVLIPICITLTLFSMLSFIAKYWLGKDINTLIALTIQIPLKNITTDLPGFLFIYTVGNLFFAMGIHQSVINASILRPGLLASMQENMLAYANGNDIPNIINYAFQTTFGQIGGTGNTLALIIALFLFSRQQTSRNIAKISSFMGLFNINEPLIFGLPIFFNPIMIIPFILSPVISLTLAWLVTLWGWMDPVVIQIPWTTPPLLSGFLATGGDWRAIVFQIVIIILMVMLYLPFIKLSEHASAMKTPR